MKEENRLNGVAVEFERTELGGAEYIKLLSGDIIGLIIDRGRDYARQYIIGDTVRVHGDVRGYICPGIKKDGIARITEIKRDSTDKWLGIRTEYGEEGFCKPARVSTVSP